MSDAASVFDQYAENYDQWYDSHEGKELFRSKLRRLDF